MRQLYPIGIYFYKNTPIESDKSPERPNRGLNPGLGRDRAVY